MNIIRQAGASIGTAILTVLLSSAIRTNLRSVAGVKVEQRTRVAAASRRRPARRRLRCARRGVRLDVRMGARAARDRLHPGPRDGDDGTPQRARAREPPGARIAASAVPAKPGMRTTSAELAYFAYGTLQKGFANWRDLADRLGDPVGRFRTVEPHALVVPVQPGCANPGCPLLHRMAVLVPGIEGFHAEGDLFIVDRSALAEIDRLEDYDDARDPPGLYERVRVRVASPAGREAHDAFAFRVSDPAPWRALVATGRAELLTRYERRHAHASPKRCCIASPGHTGPHDVLDPFAVGPA